ncbi:hypothetical protein AB0F18_24205 [Streptomyces sp. NPDC029216]
MKIPGTPLTPPTPADGFRVPPARPRAEDLLPGRRSTDAVTDTVTDAATA